MLKKEVANAQEKRINEYYDSLLLRTGKRAKGQSEEQELKVATTIKERKRQLHSNFDWMLAVVASINGDGFIQEVIGILIYQYISYDNSDFIVVHRVDDLEGAL